MGRGKGATAHAVGRIVDAAGCATLRPSPGGSRTLENGKADQCGYAEKEEYSGSTAVMNG